MLLNLVKKPNYIIIREECSLLTNIKAPEITYLSMSDVIKAEGDQSALYVDSIKEALTLHAERKFVQPLKPYLRANQSNGHIADRIIAMPAHLDEMNISGIKWVGSKNDNPSKRKISRASAVVVLNDPETNYPVSIMEGSLISGMRTAAVSVLGAKHLAKKNFAEMSCLGCGQIAQFHVESFIDHFKNLKKINLFDINQDSAHLLKEKIDEYVRNKGDNRFIEVNVCENLEKTVRNGEVILTCTVADTPYIPFEWISKGTFISNVSIMDFEKETFLKADKVVVDDWDQANREKKVINQLVLEGKFSKEQLHGELGEIITGRIPGRENENEIIILNPMGMAIEDIACAYKIFKKAKELGIGKTLSLY